MAGQELLPGNPRELGEQFKFIAEVTELFPPESIQESFDKVNLICTSSRFGLIFIAQKNFVKAFRTKDLIDKNEKSAASSFSCRGPVTHISVSCDGLTLFVVAIVNNCPFGIFYDVQNILQSDRETVPFYTIPLNASAHSRVVSLTWNPCDPACIALVFSTGDLSLVKIKETSVEFSNKNDLLANAVTWSAKGKQLAVGKTDGTMSLFKPDLTFVRSVQAPSVPDIGAIFDITWFTNTEFFIGYLIRNVGPALFYVNAPKGKTPTFVNFDDVCFSNESEKTLSYYTVFISEWSLLLVFSSNGVEMGVVGKTEAENAGFNWCLWSPDEDAKALMHFYNVVDETFPLGLIIDFSSTKRFLGKDEKTKGPFPFLATISSKGELNVFFMENNFPNAQPLVMQCEDLPPTAQRTPEQFGQPTTAFMEPIAAETPPPEPKPNFMSAFSSFPKKSEGLAITPLLFSTPVKSVTSTSDVLNKPHMPEFVAGNPAVSSSSLSFSGFAPPTSGLFLPPSTTSNILNLPSSNISNLPSFSNSLFSKPISMSNQIGSVGLPAPSPQKSENILPPPPLTPTSSLTQPQTAAQPQNLTYPQTLTHPQILNQPQSLTQSRTLVQPHTLVQPQALAQPQTLAQPQGLTQLQGLAQPQGLAQLQGLAKPLCLAQPQTLQLKPQTPVSESTPPPPSPKIQKESVLYHIKREEQQFEKELKVFTDSIGVLEKEVGKDEDFAFKVSLERIKEWMKEMESTTKDQSDEVSELHQETLEALALYEDAKSHRQIKFNSRNEIYIQLRPLDPYSKRKLDDIRVRYRHLISQIKDVNAKLDLQFEELANARKTKRNQRPPDNLYRSVLNLHTMRISAEKDLQKVTQQLKKLHISPIFSSNFLNSSWDAKCEKLQNILNDSASEFSLTQTPSKSSSTERNRQLKEILAQREHTPVRIHSIDSTPESVSKQEEIKQSTSILQRNIDEARFSTPVSANVHSKPVYEDISPPGPRPQSIVSSNPLAALSSLVGKVSSASPTLDSTSIVTANPMNFSASKADAPTLSSFSFSQMSKSQLGSIVTNDTKKDSQSSSGGLSLFGSSTPQAQNAKPLLSVSKDFFAGGKLNSQAFSGIVASKPTSPSKSGKIESVSLPSKSPLLEMLTTTTTTTTTTAKSISDPTTSVTPNFAQFFKGVSPASLSASTSAATVTTTSAGSLSFSSFLKTNENKDTNVSLPQSPTIPSVPFSGFGLKPLTTDQIGSKFSGSQGQENFSSQTVKTENTSVISNNPILTSQILKETSIIACSSESSSINSNTFKGSLFGLTNNTTPLFALSSGVSLPSSNKEATPSNVNETTTSSSGTSLFSQSSSQPSIFGNSQNIAVATSSSVVTPSIFSKPTTSASIFGQLPTSTSILSPSSNTSPITLFTTPLTSSAQDMSAGVSSTSQPSGAVAFSSSSNTLGSFFGSQGITTTTTCSDSPSSVSSLSGVLPDTSSTVKTTTVSLANATVLSPSSTSTFGSSSKPSLFGQSSSSLFSSGQSPDSSVSVAGESKPGFGLATSTPSLFSTVTTSVSGLGLLSSNSVFGNVQTSNSLFGQTSSAQPSSSSSSSSIFSIPTSQDENTVSSSTVVSTNSVFGSGNAFVASSAPSIFGGGSVNNTFASTAPQSIFGSGFSTVSTAPSIFGTVTSNSSVFGGASNAPTFTSSSFGSSSIFGQTSKPEAPTGSSSAWGSSSGSVFGSQSGSSFGTGTKNEGSIFGNAGIASVPSSGSIFEGASSTPTSGSVFGGTASTPSSGSIFGGTSTTPSTGSVFGGAPSTTSSVFGANNTASLFSQGSFNQNSGASPFGSGSLFSGLGKAPSKEDSSKNVFGVVKSEISSQPSIFGGGGSVPAGSSFGSFAPQKTAGAFSPIKSGPTFGGGPVFGGSPTLGEANKPKSIFGGSASFGSSPVLGGGTTSVFGSSTNTGGFGSQSPLGFSSFASAGGSGSSFSSLSNQPAGSSFTSWRA